MVRFRSTYRDLLLLIILITLIRIASDGQHATRPVAFKRAPHFEQVSLPIRPLEQAQEHEAEGLVSEEANEDEMVYNDTETIGIHEPDKHIMYRLNALLEHADYALNELDPIHENRALVKGVKHRLLYLRRKYQHTSPAIVLLGPIGTAGIVLQEQALEKELAHIETTLNNMVNS